MKPVKPPHKDVATLDVAVDLLAKMSEDDIRSCTEQVLLSLKGVTK